MQVKILKDLPKEERFLSMTTTLSIGTELTIMELAGKAVGVISEN